MPTDRDSTHFRLITVAERIIEAPIEGPIEAPGGFALDAAGRRWPIAGAA